MPVVLLKSATKQIQEGLRSIAGSVGRSGSFGNDRSAEPSRNSSFGHDRLSRQSSVERMDRSGHKHTYASPDISPPIQEGRCLVVAERGKDSEDDDDTCKSPSTGNPDSPKKPRDAQWKEPDGDTARTQFQNLFSLRSFGSGKSPSPEPARDDSSASRLASFFRRKRESNDSLTGSTASEEMKHERRMPYFFRKKSDVSNTSVEDEEDLPRSMRVFGGSCSSSKKNTEENRGKSQGCAVKKDLSALKRRASASSHGMSD